MATIITEVTEELKRAVEETYGFKKNGTYETNYCKSIGIKENNSLQELIDLENKRLIGDWNFERENSNFDLSVNGEIETESLDIGLIKIYSDYKDNSMVISSYQGESLKIIPRKEDDYNNVLSGNDLSDYNVVATKGDINYLKNLVSINVDQMIAFLEIIKFIPELSTKIEQINSLVDSLEQSK